MTISDPRIAKLLPLPVVAVAVDGVKADCPDSGLRSIALTEIVGVETRIALSSRGVAVLRATATGLVPGGTTPVGVGGFGAKSQATNPAIAPHTSTSAHFMASTV